MNLNQILRSRAARHTLFWLCWVVGFTVIKSFGQSSAAYLGWLIYYLVTLPIFLSHTYLVAYVLIPKFLQEKRYISFIVFFLLLFYLFSVCELIFSYEAIYHWFTTFPEVKGEYLMPGYVIRNGLGNLYIVLVFLASRTVRRWYLADKKQKELQQAELRQQMENALTRVQPMMLLYAIDQIDRLVESSSGEVTHAIAKTSELLNEVMAYHEEKGQLFSREIELVRKLVALNGLLRDKKPDVEFFLSGDPGKIRLPPMILFTLVDHIFRKFYESDLVPELNIEASGFSDMVTVQVMFTGSRPTDDSMFDCMQNIEHLDSISRMCHLEMERTAYGCSLIIKNLKDPPVKAVDPSSGGVHNAMKGVR